MWYHDLLSRLKELDGVDILRIVLLVWLVIGSMVFFFIPWGKAEEYFENLSYHYSVKQIEIRGGRRGHAHILSIQPGDLF